ncbi:YncE family protein [Streptomyces spectabilis]|uniref:YncE family protein n=1 Tax=Streptomyces spectabilis TaxID=68270 RepID=A0A516R2D9_STRST|nr:YncE family protein [Streptomyces spectabilis]QDQ09826.1 YncE family protein [Streptomyces spectabilis]
MNSLVSRARWLASLLAAGALLLTGTGAAVADQDLTQEPVPGVENLTPLPAAQYARAPLFSADGTTAYVGAIEATGTKLYVVDTQTGEVTADVPTSTGRWAGPMVFGARGSLVYLVTEGTLNVIDTATDTLRASIPVPDQPRPPGTRPGSLSRMAISPDGATIYLDQSGPHDNGPSVGPPRLLVFSTARHAFTAAVPLPGESPRDIVVRPNGRDVYVSGDVGLVHLTTSAGVPKVVRTIAATGFADELALTPDGRRLYALSKPDGRAAVVDLTRDDVLTTIDFRSDFSPVLSPAVSADGTRLHVLVDDHRTAPKVLSYDTATHTQVTDETVTDFAVERASGLTVGPDGETLYLTGTNYVDDPGVHLQIVSF